MSAPRQLDSDVPGSIDLKGQTAVRLLLAVLFLAIYWAVAGPVGHVVLRIYKKTHWSWWIFSRRWWRHRAWRSRRFQ